MKNKIILDLLTYWEDLRKGRLVPARSDIDPRAIKSKLPNTFILEKSRSGIIRFRLAGLKVCDLLAMELRSMPAVSLITPDFRDDFTKIVDQVLSSPQMVELQLSGETYGNKRIKGQMLLLPMTDGDDDITRILGCISLDTPLTRAPLRFDIDEAKVTRLVAGQTADVDQKGFGEATFTFEHVKTQRHDAQVADNDQANEKTPTPKSGRPYLRVVK